MLNKKMRAFSLIELSITILIIGILVAGVMASSSLVNKTQTAVNSYVNNNIPDEDRRGGVASLGSSSIFTGTGFTTTTDPTGKTVLTFDTTGTFNITASYTATIEILVVGGGGSGGLAETCGGGGGGAGGVVYAAAYPITAAS